MQNLAYTLKMSGNPQEALTYLRIVTERRQELFGQNHPETIKAMGNLGETLYLLDEYEEALSIDRPMLEYLEREFGPTDEQTLRCMQQTAICLWETGEHEEGLALRRIAAKRANEALATGHGLTAEIASGLEYMETEFRAISKTEIEYNTDSSENSDLAQFAILM